MISSVNKDGDSATKNDFELPSLWADEDEMYHLLGAFRRPRAVEEAEYDFKVSFWRSLVERRGRELRTVVLSEAELCETFKREFQPTGVVVKPQCLGRVLAHMRAEGRLVEVGDFAQRGLLRRVLSGVAWAVASPLKWSYNRVAALVSLSEASVQRQELQDTMPGNFILVDLIPDLVYNFINLLCSEQHLHISPHIDAFSLEHYNGLLSQYLPHQSSRVFFHEYLLRNRFVEIVNLRAESDYIVIVKYARSMQTPLMKVGIEKSLKDQVVGIVQLKSLRSKLEADECTMQTKVDQLKQEVLRCLRCKKNDEAKKFLKRGKIIEKMLERKRVQIDNVESMLVQIDAADDNMQVVKALSMAAGALKTQAVDVDSVHDIMAEIGDAIADQEEINASINVVGDYTQNDILDLENELAALLVDDHLSRDIDINLPDIPNEPFPIKRQTLLNNMAAES